MEDMKIKILYVDDENANLVNFRLLFQDDYNITTTLSPLDALELMKSEIYQIVISDQRMPYMSGIEFLAKTNEINPDSIRILLTAFTETKDLIDAINIGNVYQYITKPYHDENVRNILNKAKETWILKQANKELLIQLQEKNEEFEQINEELRQNNEELYNAKEILELSERRFRTFMLNTPAYVYIKDETLKHIYSNKLVENSVSKHLENELSSAKEIFEPEIVSLLEDADRQILNGSKDQIDLIYSGYIKNELVWLHDFKFKLPLGFNKYGVGGIAFDITELKDNEKKLIELNKKAEESNQLKTAFIQNISHEIRTPMNAIIGFSELITHPTITSEKLKSFTTIIQNSTQQLLSIVNDILTISSIDTNQVKVNISEIKLNDLFLELHTIFHQQANHKKIELKYVIDHKLDNKYILTDKTKLIQILTNLITNAIKFTSNGFVEFGYSINENSNYPIISMYVKDTGIGIEEKNFSKIFERFQQANQNISKFFGGTGLGLAISKAFVELLGGTIWLESEPNNGTTFHFTIKYEPSQIHIENHKEPISSNNKKTILIAEDENLNFKLLQEYLLNLNITVLHAENGMEAIDLFTNNPNIDIILMDIKMPILDGYEAALKIKKLKPNLKIIAQSAYALEHERDKYVGNAFDDFITKPINRQDFINKLKLYNII